MLMYAPTIVSSAENSACQFFNLLMKTWLNFFSQISSFFHSEPELLRRKYHSQQQKWLLPLLLLLLLLLLLTVLLPFLPQYLPLQLGPKNRIREEKKTKNWKGCRQTGTLHQCRFVAPKIMHAHGLCWLALDYIGFEARYLPRDQTVSFGDFAHRCKAIFRYWVECWTPNCLTVLLNQYWLNSTSILLFLQYWLLNSTD